MPLRNSAIWLYRQMTARSRRRLMEQLRAQEQMPIAVLFYHRVADHGATPWTISSSDFKRHLDWLQQRYKIVSLGEAQRRIRAKSNDEFTVAITFDDGYAENCQTALPELVSRNLPVTYFVTTDFMGKQRPFRHDIELGLTLPTNNWDEMRYFASQGVDIGAHTKSHCDVGAIRDEVLLRKELIGSIQHVESELNTKCRYFAFPYGRPNNMSQAALDMLQQHGIEGMCSAYGALNWPGAKGFHIRRIHGDPGLERLKNWLTLDHRHLVDPSILPFVEPEFKSEPEPELHVGDSAPSIH